MTQEEVPSRRFESSRRDAGVRCHSTRRRATTMMTHKATHETMQQNEGTTRRPLEKRLLERKGKEKEDEAEGVWKSSSEGHEGLGAHSWGGKL
jgi:hypothetical protein